MAVGLTFSARVYGNNKAEILEATRTVWSEFIGEKDAPLPWDVSVNTTLAADGTMLLPKDYKDQRFVAEVTVNDTHTP